MLNGKADENGKEKNDNGSKMAEGSISFSTNKLRHHDITLLLKIIFVLASFLILSDTLFIKYFSLYGNSEGNLILPIKSVIWRHNDVRLRHCVNQVMPRWRKWWLH